MADDKYCAGCGSSLSVYDEPGEVIEEPDVTEDDRMLSFWAKTKLALRSARRTDVRHMRPITRIAYAIENSDNSTTVLAVANVIFFLLCVGIIAALLEIFDRFTNLSRALTSTGGGGLSQLYQSSSGEQATGVFWMVVLLTVLILLFIITGKALLRAKKIRRKKKREAEDRL